MGKQSGILRPKGTHQADLRPHSGPGHHRSPGPQNQRRADQTGLCPGLLYLLFDVHDSIDWGAHIQHGRPVGEVHGDDENYFHDFLDGWIRLVHLFPTTVGISGVGDAADLVNQKLCGNKAMKKYFYIWIERWAILGLVGWVGSPCDHFWIY